MAKSFALLAAHVDVARAGYGALSAVKAESRDIGLHGQATASLNPLGSNQSPGGGAGGLTVRVAAAGADVSSVEDIATSRCCRRGLEMRGGAEQDGVSSGLLQVRHEGLRQSFEGLHTFAGLQGRQSYRCQCRDDREGDAGFNQGDASNAGALVQTVHLSLLDVPRWTQSRRCRSESLSLRGGSGPPLWWGMVL